MVLKSQNYKTTGDWNQNETYDAYNADNTGDDNYDPYVGDTNPPESNNNKRQDRLIFKKKKSFFYCLLASGKLCTVLDPNN